MRNKKIIYLSIQLPIIYLDIYLSIINLFIICPSISPSIHHLSIPLPVLASIIYISRQLYIIWILISPSPIINLYSSISVYLFIYLSSPLSIYLIILLPFVLFSVSPSLLLITTLWILTLLPSWHKGNLFLLYWTHSNYFDNQEYSFHLSILNHT